MPEKKIAVRAKDVPPRPKQTNYPPEFAPLMRGREKHALGDIFALKNFGVNLTRLAPKGFSSIFHRHTKQDEFIYILEGKPTLITEEGEMMLEPGMCAGFPANGAAHQLVNNSNSEVVYLEIGDRIPGDSAIYPRDDLKAVLGADGKWIYTRKDGTPI